MRSVKRPHGGRHLWGSLRSRTRSEISVSKQRGHITRGYHENDIHDTVCHCQADDYSTSEEGVESSRREGEKKEKKSDKKKESTTPLLFALARFACKGDCVPGMTNGAARETLAVRGPLKVDDWSIDFAELKVVVWVIWIGWLWFTLDIAMVVAGSSSDGEAGVSVSESTCVSHSFMIALNKHDIIQHHIHTCTHIQCV